MDPGHPHAKRHFTGRTCNLHPDPVTRRATDLALARAEAALRAGRLITPAEAMALALGAARDKETLFTIARTVAWETDGDQEDILCRLGERYPDFA